MTNDELDDAREGWTPPEPVDLDLTPRDGRQLNKRPGDL